jgi:hypothetical protein
VITLEHIDIDNSKQIIFCNFDQKIKSPLFHLFQKFNTCKFDQKMKSQTDGWTHRQKVGQTETTDGQRDRQTDQQMDRQTGWTDRADQRIDIPDGQVDRQTNHRMYRQTGWTDRQTEQTDR